MAFSYLDTTATVFDKIGYVAIHKMISSPSDGGDSLADWQNGVVIPAVIDDSVDFAGDEATQDPLQGIDGKTIVPRTTPGTFVVDFNTADLGDGALTELLGATASATPGSPAWVGSGAKVTKLPAFSSLKNVAVSFVSLDGTQALFCPNVQIDSQLTYTDDVVAIACTATVLAFNGDNLEDINFIENVSLISDAAGTRMGSLALPTSATVTESAATKSTTKSNTSL